MSIIPMKEGKQFAGEPTAAYSEELATVRRRLAEVVEENGLFKKAISAVQESKTEGERRRNWERLIDLLEVYR